MTRHKSVRVVVRQFGSENVTVLPVDCQKSVTLGAYSASPAFAGIPSSQTRHGRSLPAWVREISAAWARGAANTLHLARLVSEARRSLQYGGWSQLWRSGQVPFSKRKGEMLVVIGSVLGNLVAQNAAQLPSAWNTLYWLARLGRRTAEELILLRRIHPGLTAQAAKALLREFQPREMRKSSRARVKQRLARFAGFVRATVVEWSPEERQFACVELSRLTEAIGFKSSNSQGHDPLSATPTNGAVNLNTVSVTVRPQSVIH